MGVNLVWEDDTKRVLRFNFEENWTWDEFFVAKKQAYIMIDSIDHKVGVIVDISTLAAFQPNILANSRQALSNKHPNTFVVVIVVARSFARTMISLLYDIIRFSAIRVEIAASLDEARAIVAKRLDENAAENAALSDH